MASAVVLAYPKDGYGVLMFRDAFDKHSRSFLSQIPTAELEGGVEVVI